MAKETTNTGSDSAVSGSRQERLVMRRSMKEAVGYLKAYMETYDQQQGYESYSVETLVDDVLYGLGEAIAPGEHRFAQGFEEFKKKLRAHLGA